MPSYKITRRQALKTGIAGLATLLLGCQENNTSTTQTNKPKNTTTQETTLEQRIKPKTSINIQTYQEGHELLEDLATTIQNTDIKTLSLLGELKSQINEVCQLFTQAQKQGLDVDDYIGTRIIALNGEYPAIEDLSTPEQAIRSQLYITAAYEDPMRCRIRLEELPNLDKETALNLYKTTWPGLYPTTMKELRERLTFKRKEIAEKVQTAKKIKRKKVSIFLLNPLEETQNTAKIPLLFYDPDELSIINFGKETALLETNLAKIKENYKIFKSMFRGF